jgi:opacity protein-like surface antigen
MKRYLDVFWSLLSVATILVVAAPASGQDRARFQVRASFGYEQSQTSRFADRSCDSAPLLNFFGCQPGEDGLQLGSQGDFGSSVAFELAAGIRIWPFLRIEAAAAQLPNLQFSGNANFLGAGNDQPVRAAASATPVMTHVVFDLGPFVKIGRVEPFVGAGAGWSRNRLGGVVYRFPDLNAQPSTTTTVGGAHWAGAWDARLGVAVRMVRRTRFEAEYRFSDLGWLTADDGAIDIVRGSRQLTIAGVAGTRARLQVQGVYAGIRWER